MHALRSRVKLPTVRRRTETPALGEVEKEPERDADAPPGRVPHATTLALRLPVREREESADGANQQDELYGAKGGEPSRVDRKRPMAGVPGLVHRRPPSTRDAFGAVPDIHARWDRGDGVARQFSASS